MPSNVVGDGARRARPRPPRRPRRRFVAASPFSESSSSSVVLALGGLLGGGLGGLLLGGGGLRGLLLGAARLGLLELGGDQRVVFRAEIDLVVEVDGDRFRAVLLRGARSFSRLKASICWTVTSSWCAIHASVRPWRTQVRIWFRWGFSERRAIGA